MIIILKNYKKIKNKNILTYGLHKNANYRVTNPRYYISNSIFDLHYTDVSKVKRIIKNINLKLIGKHNILNAAAAVAVCLNIGVKINIIKSSLKNFSGVQRRMTKIFSKTKMNFLMIMHIIQLKFLQF